jgi:VanZ family protein|tara:strand:+ start:524 stop:946 length:423 start_codon:yes stop_codon:yes gene_type:complete
LITDKTDKINKIIMKKIDNILIMGFHLVNFIFIIFYLYPGSIFGYFLYNNPSIQPQLTRDFFISSNHFYVFIILSTIGILAYHNTKKINFLIKYLFLSSIFLEFFHIIIPNRGFQWSDLFGNIFGVIIVIIIYKIKDKYA